MQPLLRRPFSSPAPLACAAPLVGRGRTSSSSIAIDELLPSNSMGCADSSGQRNDGVELCEWMWIPSTSGGYPMTGDTTSPTKSAKVRGVLLLWADESPDQEPTHLAFQFMSEGRQMLLCNPEETVDRYRRSDAVSDVSFARVPDGTGDFVRCARPSCGSPNGSGYAD